MAIRDEVVEATKEIGDFVLLWFDETDNKDQLLQMMTEGGEAGLVGYQLFKKLSEKDRLMAGLYIADSIAEVAKIKYLKFSDEE